MRDQPNERDAGPTPAGGMRSEAIRDERGRVVEIVEYAEDGTPIARTYTDAWAIDEREGER